MDRDIRQDIHCYKDNDFYNSLDLCRANIVPYIQYCGYNKTSIQKSMYHNHVHSPMYLQVYYDIRH